MSSYSLKILLVEKSIPMFLMFLMFLKLLGALYRLLGKGSNAHIGTFT